MYNAAFAPLAAKAHPLLMGQPFAFGFPELVPLIKPLFERGMQTGQAQDVVEAPMMVDRNGYREETFFTSNFTPVRSMKGEILGFYNAFFEVTSQKIADRRQAMLNLLATPSNLSTETAFSNIIASLATDALDIPMAILHEADTNTQPGKTILRVRGQLGIPQGHELLRNELDLQGDDVVADLCHQAMAGRMLTTTDERFHGVEWLGFNQAPKTIVTMALRTGIRLFGFLTIGTNPYRPFDDACDQFVNELSRTTSSVLAAAFDAESLRQKQQQLQNDLAFSDMKVRHLVEHASIGMAHAQPDGKLLWANDKFHSLVDLPSKINDAIDSVYAIFCEDDQKEVREFWAEIFVGEKNHVSAEFRIRQMFEPPRGLPEPAHVQILAFPFKEHGVVVSGMACITDISRLKWAEAWQARIAQDARDSKRQQEAFIDVVSHEMRNPLSAIVHCADAITLSLDDIKAAEDASKIPASILEAITANASAASTILDCCRHQKRIIDDVLTLSRLEATLLSVKPSAGRPSELIDSVIAMFDTELQSKSISTQVLADASIDELQIDYLNFDSSRVVQIFINLLTNAIKFMNVEGSKTVTFRYSTTLFPPGSTSNPPLFPGIQWAPKGTNASHAVNTSDWGTGDILYLIFSLSDTGIGMQTSEIDQIFQRFRQASIKTHVTYGGSGLGLHISKELTEKMGGEIGVMSSPNEGSTFVFYIKTRRTVKDPTCAQTTLKLPSVNGLSLTPPTKLRTLLVEDNLVNQKVLRKALMRYDCDVEVANHGVEALDILCKPGAKFDIVLMDMQMPVMDGLTCTREIRALEEKRKLEGRLPIVAVTANVRPEQIESAMAAGADRVVQKPFKAAELVTLMREMAGGAGRCISKT